ncbi:hypothetical protein P376_3242 [Streptomyces sp. HCCB10043]|nr:hypothetical protein P376_3242 [Streptomyces sp. HCCB10043]
MVSVTWTSFLACGFPHEWPEGHGSQESGHDGVVRGGRARSRSLRTIAV